MTRSARGTFVIRMRPGPAELDGVVSRFDFTKTFEGELAGTGAGLMLSVGGPRDGFGRLRRDRDGPGQPRRPGRRLRAPAAGDDDRRRADAATARSAVDLGRLAGLVALDRLPLPAFARRGARQLWQAAGAIGMRRREEVRAGVIALLDAAVPLLAREILSRVDAARLVGEYVDVDAIVDRVDLDQAVARLDIDRIIDRLDVDEIAARLDLDRVLDRIDLDEIAGRIDLDRVVDRVDLDRAAARIDLDPLLARADVVGLARYVVDAIDLPDIIRSSTGTMTSDMVRGVRAQSADADEAVARVVDRLLRRRGGRNDVARRPEL